MAKPVLHIEKVKGAGSLEGRAAHNARSIRTPNADPAKTHQNHWLVGSAGANIRAVWTERLTELGIDTGRLRADAVEAYEVLLSASADFFRPDDPAVAGSYQPERMEAFQQTAMAFMRDEFGDDLVISAVVHLDESTPHVQLFVLPVMRPDPTAATKKRREARLSAKEFMSRQRVGELQESWDKRLQALNLGVEGRQVGARIPHQPIKKYYAALAEAKKQAPGPGAFEPRPPPKASLMEGAEAREKRTKTWQREEARRLAAVSDSLVQSAARARLAQDEAAVARQKVEMQASAIRNLKAELAQAKTQVADAKAEAARVRPLSVVEVARALNYEGEIAPKENAIDLVKRVGELTFNEAVTWLAQVFPNKAGQVGGSVAAAYERQIKQAVEAEPVLTKQERFVERIVAEQLDALSATQYRLTALRPSLVEPNNPRRAIAENLCKDDEDDEGSEKLLDAQGVRRRIRQLIKLAMQGCSIVVTPISVFQRFILLDGVKEDELAQMRQEGLAPAVVVETKRDSFDVMFKTPRIEGDSEESFGDAFRFLNRGKKDPRATGLEHPMRLAGLPNRKAWNEPPDDGHLFVRLIEASNRMCGKLVEFAQGLGLIAEAEISAVEAVKVEAAAGRMRRSRHQA
jgi:hypothetical protein